MYDLNLDEIKKLQSYLLYTLKINKIQNKNKKKIPGTIFVMHPH